MHATCVVLQQKWNLNFGNSGYYYRTVLLLSLQCVQFNIKSTESVRKKIVMGALTSRKSQMTQEM